MTILVWLAWLVVLGYVADVSYHAHATLRWLAVPVFWLWAAYGVLLVPKRIYVVLRGWKEYGDARRARAATARRAAVK